MLNRLNSPLVCLLIVASIFSVFIFGRLRRSGFDFSSFVVAGDYFCDPARVPAGLTVLQDSGGFDGQFYYRLALNPFTSRASEFGITLDAPSYRQQRILYPLLAWMLSLGNAHLVPIAMILINFVSLCTMGWIGGIYAQTLKRHAMWGIFLPMYPGFLFSLSRDLVEILEITLLLGSLTLIRRSKPIAATLLLALAVLTKETALLVAAAASLVYLFEAWQRRGARSFRWHYFAVPLAVFCIWQAVLFYNWVVLPVSAAGGNALGLPFAGPLGFLRDVAALESSFQRHTFVELVFLITFTCGVLFHLRSTAASLLEKVSWLLFAALAVSLSRAVWVEDWSFFRAVSQFCAFGTLIIIAGGGVRTKAFIFCCAGLLWVYLFVTMTQNFTFLPIL